MRVCVCVGGGQQTELTEAGSFLFFFPFLAKVDAAETGACALIRTSHLPCLVPELLPSHVPSRLLPWVGDQPWQHSSFFFNYEIHNFCKII